MLWVIMAARGVPGPGSGWVHMRSHRPGVGVGAHERCQPVGQGGCTGEVPDGGSAWLHRTAARRWTRVGEACTGCKTGGTTRGVQMLPG